MPCLRLESNEPCSTAHAYPWRNFKKEIMTSATFFATINPIIDNLLRAGGTPQAVELASAQLKAIPVTEDEFFRHLQQSFERNVLGIKPPSRLETARRFYSENVELLRGAAFDSYPEAHPADADRIVSRLHQHLHAYRGPKDEGQFLAWAIRFVRDEASTLRRFHQLIEEHRRVVLEGIWSVLRSCMDLLDSATVDDIESTVWEWLWHDHSSPLHHEGTASISTRLYGKARWLARAWKTSRLRDRARFSDLNAFEGAAIRGW